MILLKKLIDSYPKIYVEELIWITCCELWNKYHNNLLLKLITIMIYQILANMPTEYKIVLDKVMFEFPLLFLIYSWCKMKEDK